MMMMNRACEHHFSLDVGYRIVSAYFGVDVEEVFL